MKICLIFCNDNYVVHEIFSCKTTTQRNSCVKKPRVSKEVTEITLMMIYTLRKRKLCYL